MLSFIELAKQNGIPIPSVSTDSRKFGRYLLKQRKRKYETRFREVECEYRNLCIRLEYRSRQWNYLSEKLKKEWGQSVPKLENPVLSFKTIEEAHEAISKEIRRLGKPENSPQMMMLKIENQLRDEWIKEIVAGAPDECTLIVIKDTMYHPYEKHVEEFDKKVSQKEPAEIMVVFVNAYWVAFKPKENVDTSHWAMTKNSSTVEYII